MPDIEQTPTPSTPVRDFVNANPPAPAPPRCECAEDYMCAGHGTGVLGDDDRPEWADVARWEHQRDTALLARSLEDLAGLSPEDAQALAEALRPAAGVAVDIQSAVISRRQLRLLADGDDHDYAAARFLAALNVTGVATRWDTFTAGIRAAAEYRRA